MQGLNLVQELKSKSTSAGLSKDACVKEEDDSIELFPRPRYFQVHFQYLHKNIHELNGELVQLKSYVASVDEKLVSIMAQLNHLSEKTR